MKRYMPILLAPLLGLGGCATARYHCPEPKGVTCMGPREVYSATESQDQVSSEKKAARATATDRRDQPVATRALSRDIAVEDGSLSLTTSDRSMSARAIADDVPVRMPAKIMRVWLAPWEDAHGDLHLSERLFTEIEPRRWSVAAPAPEITPHLELLEPLEPAAPQEVASAAGPSSVPAPKPAPTGHTRLPGAAPAHDAATTIDQ